MVLSVPILKHLRYSHVFLCDGQGTDRRATLYVGRSCLTSVLVPSYYLDEFIVVFGGFL